MWRTQRLPRRVRQSVRNATHCVRSTTYSIERLVRDAVHRIPNTIRDAANRVGRAVGQTADLIRHAADLVGHAVDGLGRGICSTAHRLADFIHGAERPAAAAISLRLGLSGHLAAVAVAVPSASRRARVAALDALSRGAVASLAFTAATTARLPARL